jgi:hypothetical protein
VETIAIIVKIMVVIVKNHFDNCENNGDHRENGCHCENQGNNRGNIITIVETTDENHGNKTKKFRHILISARVEIIKVK